MTVEATLKSLSPASRELEPAVQAHLDALTKPPGSLGTLEELALRYCLATGRKTPVLDKKHVFCFAGDHGVADEGVSAYPKEVTPQMVLNMLAGGAAINVLSKHAGTDLTVVDMGVATPIEGVEGLCRKKVKAGTDNIAKGPAMSVEDAKTALSTGIELADGAADNGVHLLGTGDMGIANTTPSSALLAVLLEVPVENITGRGTGVDDEGLKRKIQVIQTAVDVNRDRVTDPLHTLAALGGFEIAGITGLILGGAARKVPVVVDGFISTAAAVVAMKMHEAVKDYLFFSHLSQEQGHRPVFEKLEIRPILDLQMRLGEGTGAALAMTLIEASIRIYNEMATFESAGVSDKDE